MAASRRKMDISSMLSSPAEVATPRAAPTPQQQQQAPAAPSAQSHYHQHDQQQHSSQLPGHHNHNGYHHHHLEPLQQYPPQDRTQHVSQYPQPSASQTSTRSSPLIVSAAIPTPSSARPPRRKNSTNFVQAAATQHAYITTSRHQSPNTSAPATPQQLHFQTPSAAQYRSPTTASSASSNPSYPLPHAPARTTSGASADTLAEIHQTASRPPASSHHRHQHSAHNVYQVEQHSHHQQPSSVPSSRIQVDITSAGTRTPGSATPSGLRKGSVIVDLPMAETPNIVNTPHILASPGTALSPDQLDEVAGLSKELSKNSYNRASHVRFVKLLHDGLISYTRPDKGSVQDPTLYPLLPDLRKARDAFVSRFALDEELWLQWLHDESMLAKTNQERIAVIELCRKAVLEETASVPILRFYGDYMQHLHRRSHDAALTTEDSTVEEDEVIGDIVRSQDWSEEEKALGREVFGWNAMLEAWQHSVAATEWHIDSGHLIWDPYMRTLLQDLASTTTPERVQHLQNLFVARLGQSHSTWDDTFQVFSRFVSDYDNANYESVMKFASTQSAEAKKQYSFRQDWEIKLHHARAIGDFAAEKDIMSDYLDWEMDQKKRNRAGVNSYKLLISLFQRANLRFPEEASFWQDHMDVVWENQKSHEIVLQIAQRATRHIPWSGDLWSRRLSTLELGRRPFEELEDVKHHATSSGLLEDETVGSMDDLIKVYMAWCSYLRRRAFTTGAGEDERDMAEVGIESSIENVMSIGEGKYGNQFKGDPFFRIERIFFKFYAESGEIGKARELWKKLAKSHGNQFNYWEKRYDWEMVIWGKELGRWSVSGGVRPLPLEATRVLYEAVRRRDLDYSEQMIDTYLHHCMQHETIQRLHEAQIECRQRSKEISKQRAKDLAVAQQQQAAYQEQQYYEQQAQPDQATQAENNVKRKHDDDYESSSKRPKTEAEDQDVKTEASSLNHTVQESSTANAQSKRDRENLTLQIKGLPSDIDEKRVRQFYRDCGVILSVHLTPVESNDSITAAIEFSSQEDVQTAQMKLSYKGHVLDVEVGTHTVVYVANYSSDADEHYIRQLFEPYGEVVEVRFPSLQGNAHRRFCYVQFLTASQAEAAQELDGKDLGNGLKLLAKISNPSARKAREGAQEEGRELFATNVDWSAKEADLKELFQSEGGAVQSVRITRDDRGRSKGIAYVVFDSKDAADKGLKLDKRLFKGRVMTVKRSERLNKKQATSYAKRAGSVASDTHMNGDSPAATEQVDPEAYARRVAIMNLPDTVNDARVRALVEPHGALKRITLRPDHQGAILEFEDTASVGKVSMMLEGHEIEPGRFLRMGEPRELYKQKPERKFESAAAAMAPKKKLASGLGNVAPISRPGQSKRGGRMGLGFKASAAAAAKPRGGAASATENGQEDKMDTDEGKKQGGKSQDDFRAMLHR